MSLNGSPKYNPKDFKEIWNKKSGLNESGSNEDLKDYEEEKKRIEKEQDRKYLIKNLGASSNINTGEITKIDKKGNSVELSKDLKRKSLDQMVFKSTQNKIERARKFSEADPGSDFSVSEFNELAKEVYTIKDESIRNKFAEELINIQTKINTLNIQEVNNSKKETIVKELEPENKIDKLSKKGVGMTWPTQNKKVASYIERLCTADLSKGEHWSLVKEFGKDLGKKGSEYLITTPLGIEKNRKKIKDEIEKVMDYLGFEELIHNDKFMKKNNIKKPYQLSSLLEKLQEPGFDLFKDEKDKLKNDEKKIIKKAIDLFNYYKSTPEYMDDKNEAEEEKADTEARKKNKNLSKRLNRLVRSVNIEDLKKKKRDIVGIREKADFREFIETLENSTGLSVIDEEEYKQFIERALIKIREDNLLSRGQVREIEDYILKSKAA